MSGRPASERSDRALSEEQQEVLNKRKVALRMENEEYLRQHPELRVLTGAFMSAALREEPEDTVGFAAQYFQRTDLKSMVTKAIEDKTRAH